MIRSAQPPLYVTSPPATGYDGQEVFVPSGVAGAVQHLRWREAVATWEAVGAGGSPEAWREVGTSGQPAYATGWGTAAFANPARFYKHEGRVYLGGVATRSSGSSLSIFTLPAGYRPDILSVASVLLPAASGSPTAAAVISIPPNGVVSLSTGAVTNVSLEGLSFRHA